MNNLETLIGKSVSFGVMAGSSAKQGTGVIKGITIEPSKYTQMTFGLVGDRAGDNIIVPSQPGQGKVIGVNVTAGGKRRKTIKKRKSKY